MAYTEAQKTALKNAIATGTRRVTYDGKTVEYRDFDEMKRVLADIDSDLAAAAGTAITRQIRIYAEKGL